MTLFVFSLMALPLWLAIAGLYFHMRSDRSYVRLLAKCGGTFLAVCSAGLALYLRGEYPLFSTVFWFFVLCMLADALLEISFVPGMLLFGSAHVCLIVWLWGLHTPTLWSLLVWVVAYIAAYLLFRREIPKLGRARFAFFLYPAVLGFALSLALPLPFVASPGCWTAALGMLCFFISDMMVAKQYLLPKVPKCFGVVIMALYWSALYLISCTLW